jgi:hypothetical protein
MARKRPARNGVFTASYPMKKLRFSNPLMGSTPHYAKELNLINYINLAEIVKYFTNFACGVGAMAIKFPRSSNRFVSVSALRKCLMKFTVSCAKKTIDGE